MPGDGSANNESSRYKRIIEHIFFEEYEEGAETLEFDRSAIDEAARKLKIPVPKNIGDVVYSFRNRRPLPMSIQQKAPRGKKWVIRSAGKSKYRFEAIEYAEILPNPSLMEIKLPDATPGIISRYALDDEQALLAKLRYNRLIDIFTGVTCYSLQNHLRTSVRAVGQTETDEVYIGLDRRGVHYVFPVQAKGGRDRLSVVQIEQDVAMCEEKFPGLVCQPIAAQFMSSDLIALFALVVIDGGVRVAAEKHYRLVDPEHVSPEDLAAYRSIVNCGDRPLKS